MFRDKFQADIPFARSLVKALKEDNTEWRIAKILFPNLPSNHWGPYSTIHHYCEEELLFHRKSFTFSGIMHRPSLQEIADWDLARRDMLRLMFGEIDHRYLRSQINTTVLVLKEIRLWRSTRLSKFKKFRGLNRMSSLPHLLAAHFSATPKIALAGFTLKEQDQLLENFFASAPLLQSVLLRKSPTMAAPEKQENL